MSWPRAEFPARVVNRIIKTSEPSYVGTPRPFGARVLADEIAILLAKIVARGNAPREKIKHKRKREKGGKGRGREKDVNVM